MKKILITGGSGFIGKNLTESLSKEYSVFSPTHKQMDLLDSNSVTKFINKNKIDVVIHCAIKPGEDVLSSTILMFTNLARNIDRIDKMIYFGSGAEYAKIRDLNKIREKEIGKFIPPDEYGLAKYTCNLMAQNEKKIINLRLFGVYGRYEGYLYKFISNSIVKNLLKLPIDIKQDVIFDYLYIEDLIPIVEYFLNHKSRFTDYNITPDESISLKGITKIINSISDFKSPVEIINKKNNYKYTASNRRLKKEIPHLKFTSSENGIKMLFQYYKRNVVKLDKTAIILDHYIKTAKIRK